MRAGNRRLRAILIASAAGLPLLNRSLAAEPDSRDFYLLTAGVAATWMAGAMAAGPAQVEPKPLESTMRLALDRVVHPTMVGAGAFAVFWVGAHVARWAPPLDRSVAGALKFANEGSIPLTLAAALLTGAAEEVFFRGPVYDAVGPDHQVLKSTAAYAVSTIATGSPALILASVAMGSIFSLQRKETDGVIAPMVTHLIWSTLMVLGLSGMYRDHTH